MIRQGVVLFWLAILPGCHHGAPKRGSAGRTDPSAQEILTLVRGSCFGDCPSYEVTLFQSGRVLFGRNIDPDLGPPAERVVPAAVDKIRPLTRKLDGLDIKCCNCADMTDMPSATITYRGLDGRMRTIEHYHGCEKAPDWLYAVENEIDAILETERWIGRKMNYGPYHPTR